jgi:putative lipoic acid-binding regulatory protein
MEENKSEDFYARLKDQLLENTNWPADYLYKFIVPTDDAKIDQIHTIFDNTGAVINLKKSKNGTYTSISVTVNLKSPDEVIAKYKEVSTVEGVISL